MSLTAAETVQSQCAFVSDELEDCSTVSWNICCIQQFVQRAVEQIHNKLYNSSTCTSSPRPQHLNMSICCTACCTTCRLTSTQVHSKSK